MKHAATKSPERPSPPMGLAAVRDTMPGPRSARRPPPPAAPSHGEFGRWFDPDLSTGRRRRSCLRMTDEGSIAPTAMMQNQGKVDQAMAREHAPATAASTAPIRMASASVDPERPTMANAGSIPAALKRASVSVVASMVFIEASTEANRCFDPMHRSQSFRVGRPDWNRAHTRRPQIPNMTPDACHSSAQGQPRPGLPWSPGSSSPLRPSQALLPPPVLVGRSVRARLARPGCAPEWSGNSRTRHRAPIGEPGLKTTHH